MVLPATPSHRPNGARQGKASRLQLLVESLSFLSPSRNRFLAAHTLTSVAFSVSVMQVATSEIPAGSSAYLCPGAKSCTVLTLGAKEGLSPQSGHHWPPVQVCHSPILFYNNKTLFLRFSDFTCMNVLLAYIYISV